MYTIKLKELKQTSAVIFALGKAITNSRFSANLSPVGDEIRVKPVRLREAKPYCGQHPGECFVGPTRKGRWLEWDDWVEFHGVVNDVLDRLGVSADVWTNPPEKLDHGRKMWVRRGTQRRLRYEWTEGGGIGGRPIRIWNHGTQDQFR